LISPIANLVKEALSAELPISRLVGEMSRRTEGRAVERLSQKQPSTDNASHAVALRNRANAKSMRKAMTDAELKL
jgi:predicted FMN-binding regulatory protein PaiB